MSDKQKQLIESENEAILQFRTHVKAGATRPMPKPLYGIQPIPLYGIFPLYGIEPAKTTE